MYYMGVLLQRGKLATIRAIWGPIEKAYTGYRLVRQPISRCCYKGLQSSSRCQGPHLLGSSASQLER